MTSSAILEWLTYVLGIGGVAGFIAYEFSGLQTYRDRKPVCWAVISLTGPGTLGSIELTVRNRAPADLFIVALEVIDPGRLRLTGPGAEAGRRAPIDATVAPCPPLASAFPTGTYTLPCAFLGTDMRAMTLRLVVRHPRSFREEGSVRLTARVVASGAAPLAA